MDLHTTQPFLHLRAGFAIISSRSGELKFHTDQFLHVGFPPNRPRRRTLLDQILVLRVTWFVRERCNPF